MGTGREANIRVGTSEREQAVAALADHLANGRLDLAEYEQRVTQAAAARTRSDLRALFDDLPDPHPTFDEPARAPAPAPVVVVRDPLLERPAARRNNRGLALFLGVAGVCTLGVVAVTSTWWALAPLAILALILVFTS
ncbi:DUF1707 SHOCT-like domain-containing protein [Actinokineospora globicatena]|uniref:DUF1707 domain-containing protein n=1 Tax=Actinokineospora globicatena TaxID=103729 RepID=A0A9W6QUI6_9PSEU|nr:DUF1707 domain-containing protein [Actinokineospora globicatena]GLW95787.1 hypothetical protein Aglo03_66030 [Actinokineospora globicatena]